MKIPGDKKEIVYRTIYELAGVKCDVCGRIITPPSEKDRYKQINEEYKYYTVTTGHNDWGNDSWESIKHYDICPECVVKFTSDYLDEMKDSRTAYIEIGTTHVYFNDTIDEDEL